MAVASLFLALPLLMGCVTVGSNTITQRPVGTISGVYWVDNCLAIATPMSVRLSSGPDSTTLRLVPANVLAPRQRCVSPVQGAYVVMSGNPEGARISYVVTYTNGRESYHSYRR